MIFHGRQLLERLLEGDCLRIQVKHERDWMYYHKQYDMASRTLIRILMSAYGMGRLFMPFLFTMRHSIELFLKYKIARLGENVPQHHNIKELSIVARVDDENFLKSFTCLQCEFDGTNFRYLSKQEQEKRKKNIGERVCVYDACNYYCSFLDHDESLAEYAMNWMIRSNLTFYPEDCDFLGIVATQSSYCVAAILSEIEGKRLSIDDVYLPLLFLLRHTLEVKLKDALFHLESLDAGNGFSEEKIIRTHRVNKLYEMLLDRIREPFKLIKDEKFKVESENLRKVAERYKNIIEELDPNSLSFRFPRDKKGRVSNFSPKPDCLYEILKLYLESDSFLCFVDVAVSEGWGT